MSAKTQKATSFHFVTGNPRTENERRVVRTIVRSNASNRRWRLVREQQKLNDDTTREEESLMIKTKTKDESDEVELADQSRKQQKLDVRQSRRRGSHNNDEISPDNPLKTINLAQYYFGSMPGTDVSKETIRRMLQGTAMSYAALFPSGQNTVVSQMAKDWFQQCLSTRGILHTALYCQAVRMQAVRPGSIVMSGNELVLCQTEAVHAINDKLTQPSTAIDDESIRIVFSLMWHGAISDGPPPRSPRQAPMADLQALRLFMGVIAPDPIHAQGLDNMLALRGGLDKVQMPGLAFLVSFGDILKASCNLMRPTWGYGSYAQHVPEAVVGDEWINSVRREDHPLASLGIGFPALDMWLSAEEAARLYAVFADLANYTRATYDFINGFAESRNRAIMADQRNSVQHKLMSLRLSDDEQCASRDVYDLCWLVGVAYSMIAVFPLSPKAAQFDRLARLIRFRMVSPAVVERWTVAPRMAVWMAVIGALCAIGTLDRDWYIEVLRQECERLNIKQWQDLQSLLLEFLWFPLSSDPDGQELWAELKGSGQRFSWQAMSGTG